MRIGPIPALVALVLAFGGCGHETEEAPRASRAPRLEVPVDVQAALAWVEAVQDDGVALRARLDAWPLDDEDFETRTETQIALTWRLQLALRDGDVERAQVLLDRLLDLFDGEGQYPPGRTLGAEAVRMAVFDEALNEARRRMDGSRPDTPGARRALDVAAYVVADDDDAAKGRLQGTSAWVLRGTLREVLVRVGAEVRVPPEARAVLVVLSDDFTLGETVFREVLAQWARDHGSQAFPRLLVPLVRGRIRVNLRLVQADSLEEELASIETRARQAGLERTKPAAARSLERLGLQEGDAALLLADAEGRVVARLSGRFPDPRVLEPTVQRLLSR